MADLSSIPTSDWPWRKRIGYRWWIVTKAWPAMIGYWFEHTLPWFIAFHIPRRIALYAFVRVYATLGSCGQDYSDAYHRWENGEGR